MDGVGERRWEKNRKEDVGVNEPTLGQWGAENTRRRIGVNRVEARRKSSQLEKAGRTGPAFEGVRPAPDHASDSNGTPGSKRKVKVV